MRLTLALLPTQLRPLSALPQTTHYRVISRDEAEARADADSAEAEARAAADSTETAQRIAADGALEDMIEANDSDIFIARWTSIRNPRA